MRRSLPCHSEDAAAIVPEAGAGHKLRREGGAKVAASSASAGWAARSRRACSRAITISWSSIGTPEKAVGLGQMAAKVAGSIAAAQNAPLTSKPLFFRCRITSFILQRIPRSSEENCSEPNLKALVARGIDGYVAPGRAQHPTAANGKVGGPLTQLMRKKIDEKRRTD